MTPTRRFLVRSSSFRWMYMDDPIALPQSSHVLFCVGIALFFVVVQPLSFAETPLIDTSLRRL